MLASQFDRSLFRRGNAHNLVTRVAYDVGDVQRDDGFVLDYQNTNRCHTLQFLPRLGQAAFGRIDVDTEDFRGITHGEPFKYRQEQDLALKRRHLGERFLQSTADAFNSDAALQAAERLLEAMEQFEDAQLRIRGLGDQLGLLHGHFSAKPDPLVTPLLRATHGPGIAA